MTQIIISQPQDGITKLPAAFSLGGAQLIAEEELLLSDPFEGSTVDTTAATGRWAVTTASGGAITQGSGLLTIGSGILAAGSAQIESQQSFPYMPGSTLILRTTAKFSPAGQAANTREVGLRIDGSNFAEFVQDGSLWVARVFSGATAFSSDVPITSALADSQSFIDLEIRASLSEVHFIADGVEVALFDMRGKSAVIQQGALPKVFLKSANSGLLIDSQIVLRGLSLTRQWHSRRGPVRVARISSLVDTLIFRGPGELVAVRSLLPTSGSVNHEWQLRDSLTAGAGDILHEWRQNGGLVPSDFTPVNAICRNGLIYDSVAGTNPDLVFIYYRT